MRARRSRIIPALTLTALALSFAALPAAAAGVISGPGTPAPAPNGSFTSSTCTNPFTATPPCEGQLGGRTWTYSSVNTSGYSHLYWGPWSTATTTKTPVMAMDGATDGANESLPMSGAVLAGNKITWLGTARVFLCATGTCTASTRNTRFTLTATTIGGSPINFVSGPSVGIATGVPGVIPVTGDFKVNFLFEVQDAAPPAGVTCSAGWCPAVDWYNAKDTPAPSSGSPKGTITSFTGSWYWNRIPTTSGVSVSTNEDTAVGLTLSGADADGNTLTYSIVSGPSKGTISGGTGASRTYTPNANSTGSDSFTFQVSDGFASSNTSTVSVSILPINDAPTATPQAVTTDEDTSVGITLAGSDIDTPAASLTYEVVTQPSNGTLDDSGLPLVTYTPSQDYNGPDSFTFRAFDGALYSAPATVSITVNPVNDAPIAYDLTVGTPEDTPLDFELQGTDIDGDTLTYVVVDAPSHGNLTTDGSKNVTFTPDPDYNSEIDGDDSFTFLVDDGALQSAVATVTVQIPAVNDAPVAQDQALSTDEDIALGATLTATDVDNDQQDLTFQVVTGPANGTLDADALPAVVYTPNQDWNGTDSFTFIANDGDLDSAVATVTIVVNPVNDAPISDDITASTLEDTAVAIVLTGSDVDEDALTFEVVDGPSNGTLSGDAPNLTYTPDENYCGSDSFTFKALDGALESAPTTVSIDVICVNDAPVASDQDVDTDEDVAAAIALGATDVDNQPGDLTFTIVTGPSNGTLDTSNAPLVIYTPDVDWNGTDAFTFQVNDGDLDSNLSTVTITVAPQNDDPVAGADEVSTPQYTPLTFGVLGNDSDVDLDTLTVVSVTNGAAGTAVVNEDGTITYSPKPAFKDSDTITYTIEDGAGGSATGVVTILEIGCGEDGIDAADGTPAEGAPSSVIDHTVEPLVGEVDPDSAATLHALNCAYVVPAENSVDDALNQ